MNFDCGAGKNENFRLLSNKKRKIEKTAENEMGE